VNYYNFKTPWVAEIVVAVLGFAIAAVITLQFWPMLAVIAIVVALFALPWWGYRLSRQEITISAAGVESVGVFRKTSFGWKDTFYTYEPISDASTANGIIVDAIYNLTRALIRKVFRIKRHIGTTFRVACRGGRTFALDYPEAPLLESEVIAEIERSGESETTPFVIDSSGIRYRQRFLSFSELARVEVSDTVDVYRAGSRRRWAAVDLGSVHNLWLFVWKLLEHGVAVELRIDAPQGILTAIARAKMSQAAMPRAEVVDR
jgi:hypothetical protein